MSSGNLRAQHPEMFRWTDDLDPSQYLIARYLVSSTQDGDDTALAMAMEQSAATTYIRDFVEPAMLAGWTARVRKVESLGRAPFSEVSPYQLATEVYGEGGSGDGQWAIELAFPLQLLRGKTAQLFNIVIGELPRLGFIRRLRLEECRLPAAFGTGPAFGVQGIRERLGVASGPVLTRSMRPAVGIDTATMARINIAVLTGGFHMVKDDELLSLPDLPSFRAHLQRMLDARDTARDRTGERKAYLANLICEPDELAQRWELAVSMGVDAVLIAPFVQGLGTLASLARQARVPLLAHNTFGDFFSRHPAWGISQAVLASWQETLGADWFVTSGGFCVEGSASCYGDEITGTGDYARRVMPILQGGKNPEGLGDYRAAVGSDDYMLIVASWVDSHPDGLEAAARRFREAIDQRTPLASALCA